MTPFPSPKKPAASIRMVIATAVALGVALSSGGVYLIQAQRMRAEHRQGIVASLDRLCDLSALALREPLWQFSPLLAKSIVDAAMAEPEVTSVAVADDKGKALAGSARSSSLDDEPVAKTVPVVRDGAKLGTLTISMSTLGYRQKASQALVDAAKSAAMVILGSLALILLALHRRIVIPAQKMAEASRRLAAGDLAHPISASYQDELGSLADSLEATRASLLLLFQTLEQRAGELSDANGNLEARVARRTSELEEAMATLSRAQREIVQAEKLASLGRVVSGVAHELNTPIGNALLVASTLADSLRAIQGRFESGSLRRSDLAKLVRDSKSGVDILMSNLERSASLVSSFKQVAVDQASDQRRAFDLETVTREAASMLSPSIRAAGVALAFDLEPGISMESFPGPYGQVLANLVMNALIHGLDGAAGGSVTISAASSGPDRAIVTVSDDGRGMGPEVLAKIYDPFFTTRQGLGGSGLGMNIVQGIVVRVLGGSIEVSSEPGRGCVAKLDLPRMAPDIKN